MQALAMKPEFATPLLKEQIQRGFSILSVLETIPCNAPVLKLHQSWPEIFQVASLPLCTSA